MKVKKKKKTVSQVKRRADAVFSLYIRNKYADSRGYVACFTCGVQKPISEMQAAHYIKRSANSLRYSELNVFPGCVACNIFKGGNYPAYSVNLVRRFGPGILEELYREGQKIKRWTVKDLEALIERYKVS